MIRLLRFLWSGCFHVWREDKRATVWGSDPKRPDGLAVFCTCTKCGLPKRFDLK